MWYNLVNRACLRTSRRKVHRVIKICLDSYYTSVFIQSLLYSGLRESRAYHLVSLLHFLHRGTRYHSPPSGYIVCSL
jgi:hypothetical protein